MTKARVVLAVVTIGVIAAGLGAFIMSRTNGDTAPSYGALDSALNDLGYFLYRPPRENWGPGFVFLGEVTERGIVVKSEVCIDLYPNVEAVSNAIEIADFQLSAESTAEVGVALLTGAIGPGNEAELKALDLTDADEIGIEWGQFKELSYPEEIKWVEDPVTGSVDERPVSSTCLAAIDDLKGQNLFEGQLFIITRAVRVGDLKFDFAATDKFRSDADLAISDVVTVDSGSSWTVEGKTTLVVANMFIGHATPLGITRWTPSDDVAGDLVAITAQEVSSLNGEPIGTVLQSD